MGLHLKLFVLRSISDLAQTGGISPMTTLEVNEYMPLNAMLTDVAKRGKNERWGEPKLQPQSVLRGFMLELALPDDYSHKFDTDGYGDTLTFVYAGDFEQLPFTDDQIRQAALHHPDALAALAYLRALPADTPIVLYWL